MKRLIFALLAGFIFSSVLQAQIDFNPNKLTENKIIVNGKEFYLYKVKEREGFYTLERKFGVSRVEIVEHNPEAAQGLKLGQIIKIPLVKGRNSNNEELKESGDFLYHTVEKGQTLFFISRKYGVDEEDIFKYNPQARNILIVGTELKIPINKLEEKNRKDDAYIYHTVKPGETLYSIARNYNKPVKNVLQANPGLESNDMAVGTEIRLPKITPEIKPAITQNTVNEDKKDSLAYVFEDSTYYYHRIKPKDTFYAIVSQYHVDRDAVMAVNNIQEPENLKIGYIIKIPKNSIREINEETRDLQDKKHLVYRVKDRRESLADIARKFSVSEDEIKAANDNVPWFGRYKKGDLVRIPVKHIFTTKAQDKEEPDKERQQRDLSFIKDSILLAEAFIAGCDTLVYNKAVSVAVLWPFFLEANDTFNIVKEVNEEGDTLVKIKDPLEVYPSSDPLGFREFYAGISLAIDSLKRKGVEVNLYTYDTANDTSKVISILAKPELAQMDLIFGPVYTSNVKLVSEYCFQNAIKQVVPYSSADYLTINNPYVFQVNPFKSVLFDPASDFIVDNYKNSNIIVAYSGEKTESNKMFINNLKRKLFSVGIDHYQGVTFKEVDVKKYGFQGLEKLIVADKHNLVILPPESTKEERMEPFSNVVPTLENLVNKRKMTNITLFGYPDFQNLPRRELRMVFKSNTVIYSPFYVDFNDSNTRNVIQLFRDQYYTDPSAEFPYYGLLGFDMAYYFLSAAYEFGPGFDKCLPYLDLKLTISDFNFQRVNSWSGMVNAHINFLNYKRNFDIVKLNYKPTVKPLNKIELSNN